MGERSHTRARVGRRRRPAGIACSLTLAAAVAFALLQPVADAATSGTVVTVTVPDATNLAIDPVGAPPNGCQAATPGVTSFGTVLPGTSAITGNDCNVVWGSTNSSAMLRLYQVDGAGRAMQPPFCDDVVACYLLDNALTDGSPTGVSMTTAVAPADPAFAAGHRLQALDFDGSDEATIPHDAAHDLDEYTVEFWMNGKGLDGGNQQLLGKRSDTANFWTDALRNFMIQRSGVDGIQASITHSNGTRQDVSASVAGFGTGWHHVALVSQGNSGKLQLYLDGVNSSEVTIAGDVDNPAFPIYVGHRPNGGASYASNALLDEIRIHPRDLTPVEVAAIAGGTGGAADYDDDNVGADHNWTEGPNMFGACLETATNGAAGGAAVGGWAVAGNDGCTTASPAWNPIVATSATTGSKVAAVTPGPDSDAAVTLRFGFRASSDQSPGDYSAPLVFEVVAPYA